MKHHIRSRLALAGLSIALTALPLRAQSPTPEGTVITNTATASWSDANNNTYTPVTASVSMTVGFTAGVDAVSAASVTPASPSTGNSLPFTLNNIGNGTDSVSVAVTAGAGVTITGYSFGSNTYPTLAALNTALSTVAIAAGGNITVAVIYDVAAGQGGQTIPITLTETSRRTPATSDTSTTNVQPPVSGAVAVTPDGATVDRLPSNGTQYSQVFTVTNNGNASDLFNLAATLAPGGTLAVVSVNGTAGTTSSVTLAAGASASVTVVYTVGNQPAGTTDKLTLTATSNTNNTVTDPGDLTVRVIRAAITMTKQAFRDDQTTAIGGTDKVLPGEFVQYKVSVTNTGLAGATTAHVSDPLPAQVTYVSSAGDAAGWTLAQAAGTVTADLAGSLANGATRFFWVRVQVK